LVVISHYDARSPDRLLALLDSMSSKPAGWTYAVRVVVNQETRKPLELPDRHRPVEVFYRENAGFNIGAWDFGWRADPAFDAYLFLQDECRVVREDWAGAFVRKAAEANVGLVGECLSPLWDAPWAELAERFRGQRLPDHFVDGQPADRLACYQHFFARQGIPTGARGDHLQSLVLFARREVLEAIKGFPDSKNHGEAIAAEIAISKKVQALGLTIAEVGPEPFFYIEHPQWLHRRPLRRAAPAPVERPSARAQVSGPGPAGPVRRVALIFDNKARPETTGVYCRRALGSLVEVEHFLPAELSRIPRGAFDLYLNIDDGLRYRLPPDLHPTCWWAIDTHLDFPWCLEKARDFDLVFTAQRDGAEELQKEGVASATWLPLACDPAFHRKHESEKRYDVCFVGNVFPGPRADLLQLIRGRFPNTFVGQRYFDEMAEAFSASRIVFNRSLANDVNMRVFEALGCGSLLLTNDLRANGQDELFRDGVHLATYREAEELLDKIAYYLAREAARERIATAGREEALARHTYRHRMERLLAEVEKRRTTAGVPSSAGPGSKTAPPAPKPDGGQAPVQASATASPSRSDSPDPSYFEFSRPELLGLIPPSARHVLEIGCGAGRLGEALKARQPAEVFGVEVQKEAAEAARPRLDQVWNTDVEQLDAAFAPGYFDTIVCGDVLEHLRDPDRVLRRARGWLRPDGRLIASIPNVRHHSVVRGLLAGNWTYEPAGLLDRTHLRFFTRREVEKLFYRAGLTIREWQVVPGPGYDEWRERGRPGEVKVGRLHIGGMAREEAEEFYAYQFLVSATPAAPVDYGLTSIVVLTHNQLDYTRRCVDSIRQYTDEPYELVFVDNASTDGTVDYLRSLPGAKVIANAENRGFPAGVNQGMGAATGKQILLLNNDTVVTTGWLRRLLQALYRDPKVGLAGPCSNFVSGEQQVPAGYEDLSGLDGFAWDLAKANDGVVADTDRLVGFCLLIRREVVDAVGLLDERFGTGCFEDDDYCLRALKAGYRAVIARDAFVHHFGGRTFVGSGVNFGALMRHNERLFREKWGEPGRPEPQSGRPATTQPPPGPGPFRVRLGKGGGLLLERTAPVLSLCMIVRDNARTIAACLESIRPWVDEMIVVDTGSTDDTPQIAERLGARVYHFPWCDSFSAARNESLRHARGRWIFWMDSDDTIDPVNGRKLRELAYRQIDPAILGFVVQVHCPGPGDDGEADVTVVDHVKLFRNLQHLRFDGRIHEQILPAIGEAGGEVAWSDVFVVHSGYDHSAAGQKKKLERDFRLLHLELKERPEHPFTNFNLGMTYADTAQYHQAADYLRRCLTFSRGKGSHLRKAYALLVYCEAQAGRQQAAWDTCQEGLRLFPQDAELHFREAILLHDRGQLAEAVRAYHAVLQNGEERHFSSVMRGITGFKARQNLAVVYTDLGELGKAEEQWRLVVGEMPGYRYGWHGLGDNLLRQGREADVLALAERLQREPRMRGEGRMLKSEVAGKRGELPGARAELDRAVQEHPEDADARQALCRFLFEHAGPAEAEQALQDLTRRQPQDAAAFHNLGTARVRLGRPEAAAESYRQSLRLRPESPATCVSLANALRDCGRLPEAVEAWEQTLRLDPGNREAREALSQVKRG
jgi:GT2 family glycosyltransferase/tetratricopeptide (TPR) repeat protein/2-polyprenyl-3-methyl-5-hydroxy-6-metoxy-1,4-benzoquinol methylase